MTRSPVDSISLRSRRAKRLESVSERSPVDSRNRSASASISERWGWVSIFVVWLVVIGVSFGVWYVWFSDALGVADTQARERIDSQPLRPSDSGAKARVRDDAPGRTRENQGAAGDFPLMGVLGILIGLVVLAYVWVMRRHIGVWMVEKWTEFGMNRTRSLKFGGIKIKVVAFPGDRLSTRSPPGSVELAAVAPRGSAQLAAATPREDALVFFLPHYHGYNESREVVLGWYGDTAGAAPSLEERMEYTDRIASNALFYKGLFGILDEAVQKGKNVRVVEEGVYDQTYHRTFTKDEITRVLPSLRQKLFPVVTSQEHADPRVYDAFMTLTREEKDLLVKLRNTEPGKVAQEYMKHTHPRSGSSVTRVDYRNGFKVIALRESELKEEYFNKELGMDAHDAAAFITGVIQRMKMRQNENWEDAIDFMYESLLGRTSWKWEQGDYTKAHAKKEPREFFTVDKIKRGYSHVAFQTMLLREAMTVANLEEGVNEHPDDVHVLTYGSAHAFGSYGRGGNAPKDGVFRQVDFTLRVPEGFVLSSWDDEDILVDLTPQQRTTLEVIRKRRQSQFPGKKWKEEQRDTLVRRLLLEMGHIRKEKGMERGDLPDHLLNRETGEVIHYLEDIMSIEDGDKKIGDLKKILKGLLRDHYEKTDRDLSFLDLDPGYTTRMERKVFEMMLRARRRHRQQRDEEDEVL